MKLRTRVSSESEQARDTVNTVRDKNMEKTGFFERVYEVVKTIPNGKVVTYGQVAKELGTRDARRVGHALHKNPYEGEVPCHRVVNKEGRVSESFAFDGASEQIRALKNEGVEFVEEMKVDLNLYRHTFS